MKSDERIFEKVDGIGRQAQQDDGENEAGRRADGVSNDLPKIQSRDVAMGNGSGIVLRLYRSLLQCLVSSEGCQFGVTQKSTPFENETS